MKSANQYKIFNCNFYSVFKDKLLHLCAFLLQYEFTT